MKRTLAALAAGIAIGSAGVGIASSEQDTWIKNGVLCTGTSTSTGKGVVCGLNVTASKTIVIMSRDQVIVGRKGKVLYVTSSR